MVVAMHVDMREVEHRRHRHAHLEARHTARGANEHALWSAAGRRRKAFVRA